MYYFIVNTRSRTGKTAEIWQMLESYLIRESIPYQAYITEYEGHAGVLSSEVSKLPLAEISMIVVGGDGTVNEVINGIDDFSKIRFGYIPVGSGNDLARGLGIQNSSPLDELKKILSSESLRLMDIGCISCGDGEKRYFAISSGIGIDAHVCKEALTSKLKKVLNAVGMGNLTYICLTVKALFTMPTTNAKLLFDGDKPLELDQMVFIAAMNQPVEGGGVPMAPKANAFDGQLSFCLVSGIPRWKAFFLLPVLALGRHEGMKGFQVVNCSRCEIVLEQKMVLHTDGEYGGMQDKVKMYCIPGKLQLLQ